jgi:ABC-type glutathione transport system ATPase component
MGISIQVPSCCKHCSTLHCRGVSGGERKRVTTAEMLVGHSRILAMDEISTGLVSRMLGWSGQAACCCV